MTSLHILSFGADIPANDSIGEDPQVGDIVIALVPYGNGPKTEHLKITCIDPPHTFTAQKPMEGGGGIALTGETFRLSRNDEGTAWLIPQNRDGSFREEYWTKPTISHSIFETGIGAKWGWCIDCKTVVHKAGCGPRATSKKACKFCGVKGVVIGLQLAKERSLFRVEG